MFGNLNQYSSCIHTENILMQSPVLKQRSGLWAGAGEGVFFYAWVRQ